MSYHPNYTKYYSPNPVDLLSDIPVKNGGEPYYYVDADNFWNFYHIYKNGMVHTIILLLIIIFIAIIFIDFLINC